MKRHRITFCLVPLTDFLLRVLQHHNFLLMDFFTKRRTCHIGSSKSFILFHILRLTIAQRGFDGWPPYDITKVKYTALQQ